MFLCSQYTMSLKKKFLTFLGQFYLKPNHFKPKEILLPENVDIEICEQLLETKVLQPKKRSKERLNQNG